MVEGAEVFVAHQTFPFRDGGDANEAAACLLYVQVGLLAYVGPDLGRAIRDSAVHGPLYAVGGADVKQIVEIRRIEGVPLEYGLATLMRGGGWVAIGAALKDPTTGWSFC